MFQGASFQRLEWFSFRYQHCISMAGRIVFPDAQDVNCFLSNFFCRLQRKVIGNYDNAEPSITWAYFWNTSPADAE